MRGSLGPRSFFSSRAILDVNSAYFPEDGSSEFA
jgi:hypothetical protein